MHRSGSSARRRKRTSSYADPENQLAGILLTQVGASTPDSIHLMHDFWTTLYQALDN